jgi:hypothetical protein
MQVILPLDVFGNNFTRPRDGLTVAPGRRNSFDERTAKNGPWSWFKNGALHQFPCLFFMLYNNNYYYNYNYYYYILLLFLIIIIILPAKIAVICHYHPLSLSTIFWKICAIGMIIHGTNEWNDTSLLFDLYLLLISRCLLKQKYLDLYIPPVL